MEKYIQNLQRIYANTHTEDDISGRSMTHLLEQAEHAIKQSVNAGQDGRIICVGTGATGAIDKLQQIIGVALPPATRKSLNTMMESALGEEANSEFGNYLREHQPVVFVGPYEHHSNEISWRENLATVVEVRLAPDGGIDLDHLESLLQDPAYHDRMRIGAFSAASNVTGMRTPVHEIASMLHRYNAIATFDYAASAPYVEIDMKPTRRQVPGRCLHRRGFHFSAQVPREDPVPRVCWSSTSAFITAICRPVSAPAAPSITSGPPARTFSTND